MRIKMKTIGSKFFARAAFALASLALAAFATPAFAALEIKLDQGVAQPIPIAITEFLGANARDQQTASQIAGVVRGDLERSGLFQPLDPRSFIEKVTNFGAIPRFADWRGIRAQGLVTGQATLLPDGQLKVDFRLWDIFGEQQMVGLTFSTTAENWRRLGHLIADAIYERLTGEKGYFDTRIVFVSESGPKIKRRYRLSIMDQDGANPSFLTGGEFIVLSPRFSPTTQAITYMSYERTTPSVFVFDLQTGQREVIGQYAGMTFAPRFTPDGNRVVFSYSRDNNVDVYVADLRSRRPVRLTQDPGIDTSPSFAPDGSRVVFNSDRGGSPQLYVMNADGSGQMRISPPGQGRYTTPVWSPRGDLIAFTKQAGQTFAIGVMRPDGSGERILTQSFSDEGPTWSPNGRVILFTRTTPGRGGVGGGSTIWSIDLTGKNERKVITPGEASDPAWSPLNR
ncbi:MAG: Tol-Pal system beta propeller repeat protein TolB [Alphaproteobacteria bacterium]|nr:Tol-Pal system beta propeller repeat protein TolB [Alphaproteobacteria bacterium]